MGPGPPLCPVYRAAQQVEVARVMPPVSTGCSHPGHCASALPGGSPHVTAGRHADPNPHQHAGPGKDAHVHARFPHTLLLVSAYSYYTRDDDGGGDGGDYGSDGRDGGNGGGGTCDPDDNAWLRQRGRARRR